MPMTPSTGETIRVASSRASAATTASSALCSSVNFAPEASAGTGSPRNAAAYHWASSTAATAASRLAWINATSISEGWPVYQL